MTHPLVRVVLATILLITACSSDRGEWGQIKINAPKQQSSSNSYSSGSSYSSNTGSSSSSSSYRDAHLETSNIEIVLPSIVQYLTARKGQVIQGTHGKYTYKVDLFNKVEQSENYYAWNLGLFDKWDYCDAANSESELCLLFNDGQVCGNGHGRSSHVHLVCVPQQESNANEEHLYEVSEPLTCSYHMNLYIPQVCALVNDDVRKMFVAQDTTDQTENEIGSVEGVLNVIGARDTSELMARLDALTAQGELDRLWQLCVLSSVIQDEDKLAAMKRIADTVLLSSKVNDTVVGAYDGDVCDAYLEQVSASLHGNDTIDTESEGSDANDETHESGGGFVVGGLIGDLLNEEEEDEAPQDMQYRQEEYGEEVEPDQEEVEQEAEDVY